MSLEFLEMGDIVRAVFPECKGEMIPEQGVGRPLLPGTISMEIATGQGEQPFKEHKGNRKR